MAKATANCTCKDCGKHFEKVKILRNCAEAESWKRWAEEHIDTCPDCLREAYHAAERAEIANLRAEYGAQPMVGSDKQVAWAEQIQLRVVRYARDFIAHALAISRRELELGKITEEVHQERIVQNERYIRCLYTEMRASWWIDRRDKNEKDVVRELLLRSMQAGQIQVPAPTKQTNKGV